MSSSHHLSVWRKANELALRVHAATAASGQTPHADVAQRLRQLAVAIPIAIDAGAQGETPSDFAGYLAHATVLTREATYLIDFLTGLDVLDRSECARLQARIDLVRRMLTGLLRTVERRLAERHAGSSAGRGAGSRSRKAMVRRHPPSSRQAPSG